MKHGVGILSFFILMSPGVGNGVEKPPKDNPDSVFNIESDLLKSASEIRRLPNGDYLIGKVRIQAGNRLLSFPAEVNMVEGPIEYMCTTDYGKTHETVFKTKALPQHIHLGMLLISQTDQIPPPAETASAQMAEGPELNIHVELDTDGKKHRTRLGAFLHKTIPRNRIPVQPWIYTSSSKREGRFLADQEGSIVSVMEDINALANLSVADRQFDDIWIVNNHKGILKKGSRVTLFIQLKQKQSAVIENADERN